MKQKKQEGKKTEGNRAIKGKCPRCNEPLKDNLEACETQLRYYELHIRKDGNKKVLDYGRISAIEDEEDETSDNFFCCYCGKDLDITEAQAIKILEGDN
jgi:hypothetical protein